MGHEQLRVAVACCGVGHVRRGMESWACETARILHHKGIEVTLFRGAGPDEAAFETSVGCLRRGHPLNRLLTGWSFPGKWRTPLASAYALESFTFAARLIPRLGNTYDVVHLQDPIVAQLLLNARSRGKIRAQVLFADGSEESCDFLSQFEFVHILDRWGTEELAASQHTPRQIFTAPNFVDTDRFQPGDRLEARRRLGLPPDAWIVLSVGAIDRKFKRMDYLIEEFDQYLKCRRGRRALLVIAGASTSQTDDLRRRADELLGDDFRIFADVPHRDMPDLYRTADVFAFCVTHGIFGIVLAEAAATGLPCIVHDWPRVSWVAGPHAEITDLTRSGALKDALLSVASDNRLESRARGTREWVLQTLSAPVVVEQYVEMYREIVKGKEG